MLLVFVTVICPWKPPPQSLVTWNVAGPMFGPGFVGGTAGGGGGGGSGGAVIVAVPAACASVAPTGLDRSSWNVSFDVRALSWTTGTVTVADVCPGAKVSVPLVA